MRIFIAGATGTLGRRLVPLLVAAGHDVIGTTRKDANLRRLNDQGAEAVIMDGRDAAGVQAAVTDAKPDVVVHQLTALSSMTGNPKKFDVEFAETNRLRTEGTDTLLAAARAVGARRFIAQSYTSWPNERRGSWVKAEDDPLTDDPGKEARRSIRAIQYVEKAVTEATDLDGLVMRYGAFYGPDTSMSRTGSMADMIRKRRFPVVGGGTGVWSFVHIDDAAVVTALAVDSGAPGIYNIVDDEPAPLAEWLPYLAEQLGARPPVRIPAWLARPMLGDHGVALMRTVRGSSNAKAKQEWGWTPRYGSWRDGFRNGLG